MTRICVTGNESEIGALVSRIERVLSVSPELLCELRLDHLHLSPEKCLEFLSSIPQKWAPQIILTQRMCSSGPIANGRCSWDVLTWQNWWQEAMQVANWYAIDLDWFLLDQLSGETLEWNIDTKSRYTLFSYHGTIDQIQRFLPYLLNSVERYDAGVKIAAPVRGAIDLAKLADISGLIDNNKLKVCAALGNAGKAWRWSPLSGDHTYASFSDSCSTASGQSVWTEYLPFIINNQEERLPDLYVLWNQDPNNLHGEQRWNQVFRARNLHARYISVACENEDFIEKVDKKRWAQAALGWMKRANVVGASVTRPFKETFPLLQNHAPKSINTICKDGLDWTLSNTDGVAATQLIRENLSENPVVAILGKGGTGQAIAAALEAENIKYNFWRRDQNRELYAENDLSLSNVLISTWPAATQSALSNKLEEIYSNKAKPKLLVDAQFALSEEKSPLASWCRKNKIKYIHGIHWWKIQAQKQADLWFQNTDKNAPGHKSFAFVPSSKSETIRALCIAAVRLGPTIIESPSICEDTEYFANAIRSLGVEINSETDSNRTIWKINAPAKLETQGETIMMGSGATGFRFLSALSCIIEGKELVLDADEALRARPVAEICDYLRLNRQDYWPLRLPLGCELPESVSLDNTSQYASAFMIALCARYSDSERILKFMGTARSLPYIEMTRELLKSAGFRLSLEENQVRIAANAKEQTKAEWKIKINEDPSNLAFAELMLRFYKLGSTHQVNDAKGDYVFYKFLDQMQQQSEVEFSLKDNPDLAPPLWAAAILFSKKLTIKDAPHLQLKESNRSKALQEAATALNIPASSTFDGFSIDARSNVNAQKSVQLNSRSDHRLAMAFACVKLKMPNISISDKDCVSKSFPEFWNCYDNIRDSLP